MTMESKRIEDLLKDLPPSLHQEVKDFVEFLIEKKAKRPGSKLRQDWAGLLRDHREEYSSLELQKKALDWRAD